MNGLTELRGWILDGQIDSASDIIRKIRELEGAASRNAVIINVHDDDQVTVSIECLDDAEMRKLEYIASESLAMLEGRRSSS